MQTLMTVVAIGAFSLVMVTYFGFMGWLLVQCVRADLELRKQAGYPWRGH